MDKSAFFERLIELYEDFTVENTESRIKAYAMILDSGLINYDALFLKILKVHNSFMYAPSTAIVYKCSLECKNG